MEMIKLIPDKFAAISISQITSELITLRTESPSIFLDKSGSRFLFPDLSRKDRSESASRVELIGP